ncbi:MAG: hypothetical protein KF726_18935 [Anaerolineae bacterium]|nr:hypothetical protein [Anaerolineae bacterium]
MSQRQLSALRKLAQMTFILTPTDETRRLYEVLKVMKAPMSEDSGKSVNGGQSRQDK